MATLASAHVLKDDPFSPEILKNPYPFHERLRESGPVAFISSHGNYAVGRYEHVRDVLKDWGSFTSTGGAGLSDIRRADNWRQPGPVVETDPPAHTAVRSLLTKIISPAVIRSWQERFDREAVSLMAQVCQSREINGAMDISEAYVTKVFPESLGLKPHRKNMVIVGNFNFCALGPKNENFERTLAEMSTIDEWYQKAQGREGVEPGSFAEMIFLAEDAGELGKGLAQGVVRTFLRGGMDTTISGIGASLLLLARHPDIYARLRADRSRLKVVFDEAIRLESPIQSFFRTTTRAVDIGGVTLEANRKVQIFVGSANRDPRKWTEPAKFDIQRSAIPHLAFGNGIHVCIGQLIARMEGEAVLNAMLDRVRALELVGEPVYRPLNTLRTLDELPLKLTLQ